MEQDEIFMHRALELARRAEGNTSPNPMVGCVIVAEDGSIAGEGWHHKAGAAHAEVNALTAMREQKTHGHTAYVTLEPCSHYGHTGPCCDALIRAGIKRVVAALEDPNPKVAGRGLNRLREAGVKVEVGLCAKEGGVERKVFCLDHTETSFYQPEICGNAGWQDCYGRQGFFLCYRTGSA